MSEKIESQTVTMAHGAGGKQTSELIDKVFAAHFANPDLTADDAAVLNPPVGKMAVSTDGFIVSPAFFPGGNIGKLSICGTVNDLACMAAKPLPGSQLARHLEDPNFTDHHDHFTNSAPESEWKSCLDHAQKIGLGTREYELIKM